MLGSNFLFFVGKVYQLHLIPKFLWSTGFRNPKMKLLRNNIQSYGLVLMCKLLLTHACKSVNFQSELYDYNIVFMHTDLTIFVKANCSQYCLYLFINMYFPIQFFTIEVSL